MKQACVLLVCAVLGIGQLLGQEKPALKTQKEKVSYILGANIARQFKSQLVDVDPDILILGLKDAMEDKPMVVSDSDAQACMAAFQQEIMARQSEKSAKLAEKNKMEGESFLEANKKKDSVVTLASGLQYQVLVEGKGKKPRLKDTVTTHYRGTLIDGTEFDNSFKRGEPATFPVKNVIAGWTEALQLMKPGSKWRLFIPSNLAYGERGAGQIIGPNAALIFDVELISVK